MSLVAWLKLSTHLNLRVKASNKLTTSSNLVGAFSAAFMIEVSASADHSRRGAYDLPHILNIGVEGKNTDKIIWYIVI